MDNGRFVSCVEIPLKSAENWYRSIELVHCPQISENLRELDEKDSKNDGTKLDYVSI